MIAAGAKAVDLFAVEFVAVVAVAVGKGPAPVCLAVISRGGGPQDAGVARVLYQVGKLAGAVTGGDVIVADGCRDDVYAMRVTEPGDRLLQV